MILVHKETFSSIPPPIGMYPSELYKLGHISTICRHGLLVGEDFCILQLMGVQMTTVLKSPSLGLSKWTHLLCMINNPRLFIHLMSYNELATAQKSVNDIPLSG